jgi:hypothetical protein
MYILRGYRRNVAIGPLSTGKYIFKIIAADALLIMDYVLKLCILERERELVVT